MNIPYPNAEWCSILSMEAGRGTVVFTIVVRMHLRSVILTFKYMHK